MTARHARRQGGSDAYLEEWRRVTTSIEAEGARRHRHDASAKRLNHKYLTGGLRCWSNKKGLPRWPNESGSSLVIRNAGWLKKCYAALEGTLALFNPLLKAIGHERLDKPFAAVEGAVKGLFDSQSCGQCTLGKPAWPAPANCPKPA